MAAVKILPQHQALFDAAFLQLSSRTNASPSIPVTTATAVSSTPAATASSTTATSRTATSRTASTATTSASTSASTAATASPPSPVLAMPKLDQLLQRLKNKRRQSHRQHDAMLAAAMAMPPDHSAFDFDPDAFHGPVTKRSKPEPLGQLPFDISFPIVSSSAPISAVPTIPSTGAGSIARGGAANGALPSSGNLPRLPSDTSLQIFDFSYAASTRSAAP
ncbi:uncharacterized protein MONBRDRAFT_8743 [Monosiga brevicollis MX1]|uniref:Uncharacterized protein n=1 Tax=Monosiga brevicollis TaxID=81824 RepID=A9V102_MONBE|nr:uncharacterized protein MONBRDRAFT_8743 [Monosiga brevicollis MX1]EDQ88722.1 predicted protein [Monosiga brevicollis MX1]|eukprot:XP_001746335.1 hypothetical protein [Monosiga brevicollis MX1]